MFGQRFIHECVVGVKEIRNRAVALNQGSRESGGLFVHGRFPLVLAGGLGGALRTGRTLNYRQQGDNNRKLCSLYLSIMDRMGLELPSFGDATTRLAGL